MKLTARSGHLAEDLALLPALLQAGWRVSAIKPSQLLTRPRGLVSLTEAYKPYVLEFELALPTDLHCEECGSTNARRVPCQTAYYWDGSGEDPNRSPTLCKDCETRYLEYWKDMWDEYNSGRL